MYTCFCVKTLCVFTRKFSEIFSNLIHTDLDLNLTPPVITQRIQYRIFTIEGPFRDNGSLQIEPPQRYIVSSQLQRYLSDLTQFCQEIFKDRIIFFTTMPLKQSSNTRWVDFHTDGPICIHHNHLQSPTFWGLNFQFYIHGISQRQRSHVVDRLLSTQ